MVMVAAEGGVGDVVTSGGDGEDVLSCSQCSSGDLKWLAVTTTTISTTVSTHS